MRILHVTWGLSPQNGGLSRAILDMCRELSRRGDKVAIYATDWDGDGRLNVPVNQPIFDEHGVERRYFPVWPHGDYGFSLPLAAALRADMRGYNIVHIHLLYRFSSTVAAYYCRSYGKSYIVSPHGGLDPYLFYHHGFRKRLYERLFDRMNLKGAAAVHFTAAEEMELAKSSGLEFRGVVVPLGVRLNNRDAEEPGKSIHDLFPETRGRKTILFFGRITFKKGLDLLAKAFGLLARGRDDVHLLIVGPDEQGLKEKVRTWLRQEGVEAKATVAGMLLGKEKWSVLKGADVFVLPSYSENFGIAVVEAMAAGLPVVISNKVNIWREIAAERAGSVVNCDAGEVSRAIGELINDDRQRSAMGERALRLVRERFSWEVAGKRLQEMYQQILREAPQSRGLR
jgi:glycosyltransferase involved in cell wall biosynthesis